MLTQQEIDRITLEAQMEVEDLFAEFYRELLGDRAEIMALMEKAEMTQAQGELEMDNEMLGETEGV